MRINLLRAAESFPIRLILAILAGGEETANRGGNPCGFLATSLMQAGEASKQPEMKR